MRLADAEEVLVGAAVTFRTHEREARPTTGAEDAPFEVVLMFALLLTAVTPLTKDLLDSIEDQLMDQRQVAPLVDRSLERDHSEVVGVGEHVGNVRPLHRPLRTVSLRLSP
jgi:hypothetical protein